MRVAHDLGLRPIHITADAEKRVYEFQLSYWLESGGKQVPTKEIIYSEFQYHLDDECEDSVRYIVSKLQERLAKNQFNDALLASAEKVRDDWKTATRSMFEQSLTILKNNEPRVNRTNTRDSVNLRRARYEKAASFDGTIKGAPLGLEMIDLHTFGIQSGEVAVLGAFAKTGKTWSLVNSVVAARRAGYTPFVASLEISTADFEDRIDAVASGLSLRKIQEGRLSKEEVKSLHESQDEFASLGPVFIEKLPQGDRTVKMICSKAREQHSDFLVIDQLSFLESTRFTRGSTDTISEVFPELVANVSENESDMLPVLIAAQLNRKSKDKDTKVGMQHLALSSTIEQYAHIIYGLQASEEERGNNTMNLSILGSRRTPSTSWVLDWTLTEKKTRFGVHREKKGLLDS